MIKLPLVTERSPNARCPPVGPVRDMLTGRLLFGPLERLIRDTGTYDVMKMPVRGIPMKAVSVITNRSQAVAYPLHHRMP
ncbi:MAG: hypothetical protein CMP98_13545 [Gammaproteobacteria bacterium]|nr:hypothetical protein [Gammaproteobacteria bacterium]OUU06927.1 MAG: hypothetical protein CBB94_14235 [Gammaproteobacteria bacterium TMED34]